jgi:phosphonate transport system permease protein
MKTLCLKIINLFKPIVELSKKNRTFILKDGTKVTKPFSYAFINLVIVTAVFLYFWNMIVIRYFSVIRFDFFLSRIPNFFSIIQQMITQVDWSYFSEIIKPMTDTLQIAIMGTLIGALISIPIAFLAAQNIIKNKFITTLVKGAMSLIRTLPTLVYALILAFIFGYGTFVGVLATILFTFGIMTKMLYEFIETIDLGAFVAIEATGANKIKSFVSAIVPQILGFFISISLYNFEINVRSSTILGFVGAGGIGILLSDSMGLREYGKVSLMLVVLLTVVIIIESISRNIRRRLS